MSEIQHEQSDRDDSLSKLKSIFGGGPEILREFLSPMNMNGVTTTEQSNKENFSKVTLSYSNTT